ncbi:hypothetical protein B0H10DRAFT_1958599 [Mycena sp. CBHHK59/15]|nr:hypothetical protein B0H10DRAFT_1958599 [Mycena sp. CBHHK59/15]
MTCIDRQLPDAPLLIYRSRFVASNAHMFLDNNWIDVDQLKEFLEHAASDLHPIAPESPTTRVKLESDASITRLTTLEGETAVGPTSIRTKAVHKCESPAGKYGLIRGKTRGVIKQVAGHDEGMVAHSDMFSTHFMCNIIITCAKCTCEYFKLILKISFGLLYGNLTQSLYYILMRLRTNFLRGANSSTYMHTEVASLRGDEEEISPSFGFCGALQRAGESGFSGIEPRICIYDLEAERRRGAKYTLRAFTSVYAPRGPSDHVALPRITRKKRNAI